MRVLDPTRTLGAAWAARVAATPRRPAWSYWVDDVLRTDTWAQADARVRRVAALLAHLGVQRGDVVGVLLPTSYRWTLVDLACLTEGWVSAAFHPAWREEELTHAIGCTRPRAIVCDQEQAALLQSVLGSRDNSGAGGVAAARVAVLVLSDELALGREVEALAPPARVVDVQPDEPATMVFTSGTSALPKAAVLSHRAVSASVQGAYAALGFEASGARSLHWLPLAHMFGRIGPHLDVLGAGRGTFGRGVDRLVDDVRVVRPHVLFAVPRVLQRVRAAMDERIATRPVAARALVRGSLAVGASIHRLPPRWRVPVQRFARATVHRPLQRGLGGRLGVIVTGSARVDPDDKRFFESFGVAVREGYGMTETAGVASVQPLRASSSGAGRPLGGVEARCDENGELLLRGPVLLDRYEGDASGTPVLDADGWFRTGDLASISSDGSITITGRSKDALVLLTGENVSPVRVEDHLERHPWIAEACAVGDAHPCVTAVIIPSEDGWRAVDAHGGDAAEVLQSAIDAEVNVALARHERVRAAVVRRSAFAVAAGELTPTNKKRRHVIVARHAHEIAARYARLHERRAARRGEGQVDVDLAQRAPVDLRSPGGAPA